MKNLLSFLLTFCLGILSLWSQPEAEGLDVQITQLIAEKSPQFSGVILIADQGEAVYEGAFGMADYAYKQENTPQTPFPIASFTKSFTAVLIMKLVEQGTISLQDRIDGLLPEMELPKSKARTIESLLLHISGLPKETDNVYQQLNGPRDIIRQSLDAYKTRKPGKFNYNNLDYLLLGLVIEKFYEKPWEQVMREQILLPLEMEHTGFLTKDSKPEGLANCYLTSPEGKLLSEPSYFIENFWAAGNMYSTLGDMLRFDQAFYGEKMLTKKSQESMFTSHPELGYVGYSFWVYNNPFWEEKPLIYERRGGILGANAVWIRFPELNRSLIILSNSDQLETDTFGQLESLKERLTLLTLRMTPGPTR